MPLVDVRIVAWRVPPGTWADTFSAFRPPAGPGTACTPTGPGPLSATEPVLTSASLSPGAAAPAVRRACAWGVGGGRGGPAPGRRAAGRDGPPGPGPRSPRAGRPAAAGVRHRDRSAAGPAEGLARHGPLGGRRGGGEATEG